MRMIEQLFEDSEENRVQRARWIDEYLSRQHVKGAIEEKAK